MQFLEWFKGLLEAKFFMFNRVSDNKIIYIEKVEINDAKAAERFAEMLKGDIVMERESERVSAEPQPTE